MKKLILIIIVLSFSKFAVAQETYTINDSFENWELDNHILSPVGWIPWFPIDTSTLCVYRDTALSDGKYSIVLETNEEWFEGPLGQSISRYDLGHYDNVSIQFSYTCIGDGACQLTSTQKKYDDQFSNDVMYFLDVEATDNDSIQNFSIENISTDEFYDYFRHFSFSAKPIVTQSGSSYGHCKFTIDDLHVSFTMLNVGLEEEIKESDFTIYPNPSAEILNIRTNSSDELTIFNTLGTIVKRYKSDELEIKINVSNLDNGVYFVRQNNITKRFIKQ